MWRIICNSLDFSFHSLDLVSLFSPWSMTILGPTPLPCWGPSCPESPFRGSPVCRRCGVCILKPPVPCTRQLCGKIVPRTSPLSVMDWVCLSGKHPWRVSCARNVMSKTHPPTDNFPPINCALFLSFNLRHAINCDLLHLGTCLCLSRRKHSRSCGEVRQSKWDGFRPQNN